MSNIDIQGFIGILSIGVYLEQLTVFSPDHYQMIIVNRKGKEGGVHGDALSPPWFGEEMDVCTGQSDDTLYTCIVGKDNLIHLPFCNPDYGCRMHHEHLLHPHSWQDLQEFA